MMKVMYGPFRKLEDAFVARLRELKTAGPLTPVAVVAPSRRMADRLERLLALEQDLALAGVHFHTFHSLAHAVLEDAGFPDLRLIGDPLFHERLLDSLLAADRSLARRFGGATRPKALASALRSSVRDLIDAGIDPGQVREHVGDDWPEGPDASRRLSDLLELQQAYSSALERLGILSPSGLTAAAARAAEGSRLLSGFREILYYGFYDLTGLQLEFFEAVTGAHPSTVFFPYRKGHPAFRFCDEFFDLKLHRSSVPPEPCRGGADAFPLDPVLDVLFSAERTSRAEDGALRIVNTSGPRDEAWSVAKEILRLAEEEGVAFDDIGVCARSLEPYRAAISEAFRASAVPHELAEGEPLLRQPLARMALDLLTLCRRDFPTTAVLDLIASPYSMAPAARRSWPRLIQRLGISAGWLAWEAKLSRAVAEGIEGVCAPEEAAGLWELLLEWRRALTPAKGPRPWSEWRRLARETLERNLRLPADASPGELAASEAMLSAVDSLAAFEPLGPVEWDFFLDTLIERIESSQTDAPQRRGVRVLNAMDARGESFRVLFVLGLQEGAFPRQVREDPILRDEARARLKHPGGYWIARKGAGHEEERLLFYLLCSAASERLYCVYSRSDEDGKAQAPSWYLRELCRSAARPIGEADHVPRQPLDRLGKCAPELLAPQEASLLLVSSGEDASAFLDKINGGGALLRDSAPRVRALNAAGAAGPMDGMIGPSQEAARRILDRGLSPTALDSFARCPFQFFSTHVLGLEQEERLSERGEFASTVRGKVYHACLERFYRALDAAGYWKRPGFVSWEPLLDAASDETFAEYGWREMGVYPVAWKAARETMGRHLASFVQWDMEQIAQSRLLPKLFEAELRGPLPLPSVPASMAGLEFHGFADRIDLDEDGGRYRIVDYKTRWPSRKRIDQQVYSGKMHQPSVYAELALSALPPKREWTLEGAHIYALEADAAEGESRLFGYSGAQWEQDKRVVLESIAQYVREIAEGKFPIRPEDGEYGYCAHCSFGTICRKSHGRSRNRAEAQYEGSAVQRIHDRKRPKDS